MSLLFPVRCFHQKKSFPRVTGFIQNGGTVGSVFTFRCYLLIKMRISKNSFDFIGSKKITSWCFPFILLGLLSRFCLNSMKVAISKLGKIT